MTSNEQKVIFVKKNIYPNCAVDLTWYQIALIHYFAKIGKITQLYFLTYSGENITIKFYSEKCKFDQSWYYDEI